MTTHRCEASFRLWLCVSLLPQVTKSMSLSLRVVDPFFCPMKMNIRSSPWVFLTKFTATAQLVVTSVHCHSSLCNRRHKRMKGESECERKQRNIFFPLSHKSIVMRMFTLCALEEKFRRREGRKNIACVCPIHNWKRGCEPSEVKKKEGSGRERNFAQKRGEVKLSSGVGRVRSNFLTKGHLVTFLAFFSTALPYSPCERKRDHRRAERNQRARGFWAFFRPAAVVEFLVNNSQQRLATTPAHFCSSLLCVICRYLHQRGHDLNCTI